MAPLSSATNADTHEHIPPDVSATISPYNGNAAKYNPAPLAPSAPDKGILPIPAAAFPATEIRAATRSVVLPENFFFIGRSMFVKRKISDCKGKKVVFLLYDNKIYLNRALKKKKSLDFFAAIGYNST